MIVKFFSSILWLVAIVFIITGIYGLSLFQARDLQLYSISDNAASPALHSGDLVISNKFPIQAGKAPESKQIATNKIVIIPSAGYAFSLLHRPSVLITFVYLPALIVLTVELKRLIKHYTYKPYKFFLKP
ncbi:MAG TPA: hypothetical protein VFB03_03175 [Candidatus Saccharimonadales bacterium]|nr:hypothetical protein [Candidatus Saccharimonadales bacterium]